MIILLYGPDAYRREEKKRELVGSFLKDHSGLGLGYFDFEEPGGFEDFEVFIHNRSIFDAAKMAVVKNALSQPPKNFTPILKWIGGQKNTTAIILADKKPVKAFDFMFKKPAIAEEFEELKGAEWTAFIGKEAAKKRVRFDEGALLFFASAHEKNSWRAVTELEKISLTGKSIIGRKDLENFDIERAPDFWGTLNGLKSRSVADRLRALDIFLKTNEPAAKLFNVLAYQWAGKLPAFAIYDMAIKSGKLDYEEALLDLAIR